MSICIDVQNKIKMIKYQTNLKYKIKLSCFSISGIQMHYKILIKYIMYELKIKTFL